MVPADQPAEVKIGLPEGRIAYAGEQAAERAKSFLDPPNLHDPALEMAASPICFVLTPFAAAYGALSAGHQKVAGDTLAKAEADVALAMDNMAQQRNLGDYTRQALADELGGRVLRTDASETMTGKGEGTSALLETRLEELRLERTTSSETSFALTMKARVRLLRRADQAVVWEQPLEYRSGTALYLDWSSAGSLENVAKTGYRQLAQRIAANIGQVLGEGPVLAGAGFKNPSPRPTASQAIFAASRAGLGMGQITRVVSCGPGGQRRDLAVPVRGEPALMQVSSYSPADPDRAVFSAEVPTPITLQTPMTKDEAVSEAVSDVSWSLDGLQFSRNSVVQLTSMAVAVPWSLGKQLVAGIRGVSQKKIKSAEAELASAARKPDLQRNLAVYVSEQIGTRSAQPTLVNWPPTDRSTGNESVLVIHLTRAALSGDGQVNPPLALCVEARATVLRQRDGTELCSWPIQYRSASHKFTQWAAHDARLFREELTRCYQQIGGAIVEQCNGRQLIMPGPARQPMLAGEPKR